VNLSDLSATEIALGAGGLVALVAYVVFIAIPAWTSYGRWWERISAVFLTLFILATLLGVGIGVGAAIVWSYDHWASG
jgi:hypothetical protein